MTDIYTEPDFDVDTLRNLGPLRALAGIWEGGKSLDVSPAAGAPNNQFYNERIELQPMDPQTNGPQLLYGLRYHARMTKPDEIATYHEQVGYWYWEPATHTIMMALAIPRAQVALAVGKATPDAKEFEVCATRGRTDFGICSGTFLEENFRTDSFVMKVTVNPDGTWSYFQDAVLMIRGQTAFHHTDKNTLRKVAEPTPNPQARQ
jgi:hypothetical protein